MGVTPLTNSEVKQCQTLSSEKHVIFKIVARPCPTVPDLVPVTRRFFKTTKYQIIDRIRRYSVLAEDLPTSWSFIAEHIKAGKSIYNFLMGKMSQLA